MLDIAVTDSDPQFPKVWVFSGAGDGTFGSGTHFPTAAGPAGVVAADFNGDGYLDLAVADLTAGKVSVLLNSGGTFSSHVDYATASEGSFLTVGDYNGDGISDLAVASASDNTFSVLLGKGSGGVGNGTFAPYTSYVTDPTGSSLMGLASADMDGDGRFDFAFVVLPEARLAVLLQAPELIADPSSLDFGNQNAGTVSSPKSISLTNGGSADLVIYNVSSTDAADFPVTTDCGALPRTFHPGEGCTVSATFTPTAEGALSGSVRIGNSTSDQPTLIPLTGTGVAPVANLSPGSLSFGNQLVNTTSASQPLTLSNTGNADLTISSISVSSAFTQSNN